MIAFCKELNEEAVVVLCLLCFYLAIVHSKEWKQTYSMHLKQKDIFSD